MQFMAIEFKLLELRLPPGLSMRYMLTRKYFLTLLSTANTSTKAQKPS